MATKKATGLNAPAKKEKKPTAKQKQLADFLEKARELGGKLFKENRLKPL